MERSQVWDTSGVLEKTSVARRGGSGYGVGRLTGATGEAVHERCPDSRRGHGRTRVGTEEAHANGAPPPELRTGLTRLPAARHEDSPLCLTRGPRGNTRDQLAMCLAELPGSEFLSLGSWKGLEGCGMSSLS